MGKPFVSDKGASASPTPATGKVTLFNGFDDWGTLWLRHYTALDGTNGAYRLQPGRRDGFGGEKIIPCTLTKRMQLFDVVAVSPGVRRCRWSWHLMTTSCDESEGWANQPGCRRVMIAIRSTTAWKEVNGQKFPHVPPQGKKPVMNKYLLSLLAAGVLFLVRHDLGRRIPSRPRRCRSTEAGGTGPNQQGHDEIPDLSAEDYYQKIVAGAALSARIGERGDNLDLVKKHGPPN